MSFPNRPHPLSNAGSYFDNNSSIPFTSDIQTLLKIRTPGIIRGGHVRRSRSLMIIIWSPIHSWSLRINVSQPSMRNRRSVAIFVVDRLLTNSRSVRSVAGSHIMRSSVSWQRIWLLNVIGVIGLRLALPEFAAGGAGCVAIVWGWTVGLLFAVVFDEEEF